MLNHLPGNTGDVGCLPCKHIDIRPQEGEERVFLFVVKGGAYGESPSVPSSLIETFLVPGGMALGFLFLLVELSGTSSTVAQHSEEVRLPEWVQQVLPVFFFPLGASAAGASALAAAPATASR